MLNQREIIELFLERVRKTKPEEMPKSDDPTGGLRSLHTLPGYRIYKASDSLESWKTNISDVMSELGNFFMKTESPKFAGLVDYPAAESLFLWLNSVGGYAVGTGDWAFVRQFNNIFLAIVDFFSHVDSKYVRANGCYIETRMKNEFPFIDPNTVLISAVLNALWYEFLSFLSLMGNAFPNIHLSGRVEEILSRLTSTYSHDFWDVSSNDLRFAITASSRIRSGYCILVLDPSAGGLLFKQKKKKYLAMFQERWVSNHGIFMQSGQSVIRPDLLPVFWSAKLSLHGYSQTGLKAVSRMVHDHFGHIDPATFGLSDRLYNNRMLDFLLANVLDLQG